MSLPSRTGAETRLGFFKELKCLYAAGRAGSNGRRNGWHDELAVELRGRGTYDQEITVTYFVAFSVIVLIGNCAGSNLFLLRAILSLSIPTPTMSYALIRSSADI